MALEEWLEPRAGQAFPHESSLHAVKSHLAALSPAWLVAASTPEELFDVDMETTVQTKQDILLRLRQHQAKLCELGVSRLGLFGSFRHNRQTTDSDVDLMVEFAPRRKTFSNYMALSFFLEDVFQRPVELLTEESLSPHIGPHILEDVEYVSIRD